MKEKNIKKAVASVNKLHTIIGMISGVLLPLVYVFVFFFIRHKEYLNPLSFVALFIFVAIVLSLIQFFFFFRMIQWVEISEDGFIKRNMFRQLAKVGWKQVISIYYTVQAKNGKMKWVVISENIIPKYYSLLGGISGIQFWCDDRTIKEIEKYYGQQISFKEHSN